MNIKVVNSAKFENLKNLSDFFYFCVDQDMNYFELRFCILVECNIVYVRGCFLDFWKLQNMILEFCKIKGYVELLLQMHFSERSAHV